MNNFKIIAISLLLGFSINARAQELTSNGGDYFSNSYASLSWSIGEIVTSTISDGTNILTQGFHQIDHTITDVYENENDFQISVYPNPTTEKITIKSDEIIHFYELIDYTGKLIESNKSKTRNLLINLSTYKSGNYLIKVYNKKNKTNTFSIIKK